MESLRKSASRPLQPHMTHSSGFFSPRSLRSQKADTTIQSNDRMRASMQGQSYANLLQSPRMSATSVRHINQCSAVSLHTTKARTTKNADAKAIAFSAGENDKPEDVLSADAHDLVHIASRCFDEKEFMQDTLSKKIETQTNKLYDYN